MAGWGRPQAQFLINASQSQIQVGRVWYTPRPVCPPAGLELFLDLEKSRLPVPDAQHIYNKLLFDAVNQELAQCLREVSQLAAAWAHWLHALTFRLSLIVPELLS